MVQPDHLHYFKVCLMSQFDNFSVLRSFPIFEVVVDDSGLFKVWTIAYYNGSYGYWLNKFLGLCNHLHYLKMCFDESVSCRVYLMISNIERCPG